MWRVYILSLLLHTAKIYAIFLIPSSFPSSDFSNGTVLLTGIVKILVVVEVVVLVVIVLGYLMMLKWFWLCWLFLVKWFLLYNDSR